MFNLCMLNEGRQHSCVDQIEVCIRQIENLENEIRILEKHEIDSPLKEKMKYVQMRLKKHVLSKRNEVTYEPPIGSSLR